MRSHRMIALLPALVLVGACATTTTRLTPVAPERVREEEVRQRELVLVELTEQQRRLDALSFPMMIAGTELCGERTAWRWGLRFDQAQAHEGPWTAAARSAGIGDTVTVVAVAPVSPAAAAGLEVGDRIVAINGTPVPMDDGKRATTSALDDAAKTDGRLALDIVRDGARRTIDMQGVRGCSFGHIVAVEGGINAYADGRNAIIPWAMMRFAADDELRVVIAHEIAHNAMGHVGARKKNAVFGGILGIIGDIALASAGIDSHGLGTRQGLALGSQAFSQDFEREADYVGMYLLARAGLPLTNAAGFWRHFAHIDPGAIAFASTHPTTAERFVHLEQVAEEIAAKQASGAPLLPELKQERNDR